MTNPRPFTHYGLTVEDVAAAAEWYEEILGFDRLKGPSTVESGEGHYGRLVADAIGEGFETVRMVHMAMGGGAGLELFEFEGVEGETVPDPLRPGYFHIGIAERDIAGLTEEIVASGGTQRSDVWRVYPDQEYRMVYCEDPWGNILEIHTHDFERVHSNQE